MCRTILLTLAALLLVTAAAFAAPAPTAAPQPAPLAISQGACPPSLDFLAPATAATCKPAAPSTAPAQPEFMASTTAFHGFCRCSCTHIPDCNTSADCGGSACLKAITCC
jgi:hypothetical protein